MTDDETQTNTRIDTKSPVRVGKDPQSFASHALINAKLEQIQGGIQPKVDTLHQPAIKPSAEFDPIEEMKDPKFEEMTMSKIDSENYSSEVNNKENTSLVINNYSQKYIEVPIQNSGGNSQSND